MLILVTAAQKLSQIVSRVSFPILIWSVVHVYILTMGRVTDNVSFAVQ